MNTINVLNKEKADKLSALGFKYTEQRLNDSQTVYVFYATKELLIALNNQFEKGDYYVNKLAYFCV